MKFDPNTDILRKALDIQRIKRINPNQLQVVTNIFSKKSPPF